MQETKLKKDIIKEKGKEIDIKEKVQEELLKEEKEEPQEEEERLEKEENIQETCQEKEEGKKSNIPKVHFDGEEFMIGQDLIVSNLSNRKKNEKILMYSGGFMGFMALIFGFVVVFYIIALKLFLILSFYLFMRFASKNLRHQVKFYLNTPLIDLVDKQLQHVRFQQMKNIQGKVLDISNGASHNFKYYKVSEKEITEIIAIDLISQAKKKDKGKEKSDIKSEDSKRHQKLKKFARQHSLQNITQVKSTDFLELSNMEKYREYFDSIVIGNIFCEVEDQLDAFLTIDKWLKPGGRIYFSEHVRGAEGSFRQKTQDMFVWFWKVIFGGCTINRDTIKAMRQMENWKLVHWNLILRTCTLVNEFEVGIIKKSKKIEKFFADEVD